MSDFIKPEVGMGCTSGCGSDSYPNTIIEVSKSGHKIWVVRDEHGPNKKVWPEQEYDITPAPKEFWKRENAIPYTLRSDGRYRPIGSNYGALHIGSRRYYQDPSF